MIRIAQMLLIFGTICLIYITGSTSTDENLSCHSSQYILPRVYDISLEIQNTFIIVNSTVIIRLLRPCPSIKLQIGRYCHIYEINEINSDIYYNISLSWNSTRSRSSYSSKQRFDSLDISLSKEQRTNFGTETLKVTVERGFYEINVNYNCTLEEVSTIFNTHINQTETKKFLSLPRIPNEWIFPYWENPALKASITIQIKHKDTDTVLLNMHKVFRISTIFNTIFTTTRLISTHLIALVVIPNIYKTNILIDGETSIISSLEIKNDTLYAQNVILDIIGFLRKMWNDIIPPSRINYMLLPINSTDYESLITPRFVLLSEINSIYDKEVDSIVKEKKVTCFVARSVIQEMFSDWLTTFRQSNSWFLEGFLTIYGIYICDQYYNTSLLKSIVVQTRREFLDYIEAFTYDLPFHENSLISRNSTLSKLWREKAFSTFYMLNTVFKQDLLYYSMFTEAANLYYNTDNASNNTYNELSILDKLWYWNFEASLYKHLHLPTRGIKRIITSWTTQVGYPVLQVKRLTTDQYLLVMFRDCVDVDYNKPCDQNWWIPVTFKQILNTEVIANYHYVLTPDEKTIVTSLYRKNESVIVVDSAGYRVNYDRESWKHIAFFLKNGGRTIAQLSDVTLAQLLDDAFYFLVQNTEYNENPAPDNSNLDIYLELASSIFHVNNSYTAWYPIFIALETMSKIFSFPESVLSKHIKDILLEILNKFFDNTSYTQSLKNNVSNQLYHEVLKWTCILGSSKCKIHVNGILEWHFKHPAQNKLLPSWQKWIYCQGLMLETVIYDMSASWQTIFNIYQSKEKEEEFFEFLPCSRQYKNLFAFLGFLEDNSLPIPESILNARKKNDTVLKKEMSDFNKTLVGQFSHSRERRYVSVLLPLLKWYLTAETSNPKNFVNTKKKSVTVTLLFNIFAVHSKNNLALSIILLGLESGMGRDVNILAIINCIINNIYSDYDLLMISNERFLNNLLDIHHMDPFVFDAIKKKVEYRRTFVVKMRNTISFKPQYVCNYNYISKEIFFL